MKKESSKAIGTYAASLSLIEISLGSLLHSFKIPFVGHALSLNQIAFMTRITLIEKTRDSALQTALIASLLKSLSPAGKKLTPMLAILAQGLIFSFGVFIFGANILGVLLGGALAALWAFIQPVLMIYILFGNSSVQVIEHFYKEISKVVMINTNYILIAIIIIISLKIILALLVVYISTRISPEAFKIYESQISIYKKNKVKKSTLKNPILLAFKDLLSPLFIVSFVLSALFFYVTNTEYNQMFWALLRPVAIGFILFFIIRFYPIENIAIQLDKIGLHKFSQNLKSAIDIIRNSNY